MLNKKNVLDNLYEQDLLQLLIVSQSTNGICKVRNDALKMEKGLNKQCRIGFNLFACGLDLDIILTLKSLNSTKSLNSL